MYDVVDHPIPALQQLRDSLVATYGEANARAMTQSVVAAMSDIIKQHGGELSRSIADSITCPVLLIAGEQDIFAPPALASELATHIPEVKVLVAEGAEHDMYMDRPEWITRTILDWVNKH